MWRRYRCIYVLRDSSIFLGGISLRLLRETKHGSGWALATAPPSVPISASLAQPPGTHTASRGSERLPRGSTRRGLPRDGALPGRCWQPRPRQPRWLHGLPGGPAWAEPGGPFPPTASPGLGSQEPELLLPREGAGAPASPPSPVSPPP